MTYYTLYIVSLVMTTSIPADKHSTQKEFVCGQSCYYPIICVEDLSKACTLPCNYTFALNNTLL